MLSIMENFITSLEGLQVLLQSISDFKTVFNDVSDVKKSMHIIFQGFYVSENSNYMEKKDREDLSFHFTRVMELIDSIEKFNFNN